MSVTRFSKLLGAKQKPQAKAKDGVFPSHAFQNCSGRNFSKMTELTPSPAVTRFSKLLGAKPGLDGHFPAWLLRHTLFKTARGETRGRRARGERVSPSHAFQNCSGRNSRFWNRSLCISSRHTLFKTARGETPSSSSSSSTRISGRHTLFKTARGETALKHMLVKQTTLTSFASTPQKHIKGCVVLAKNDLHKPYLSKAYLDASAP